MPAWPPVAGFDTSGGKALLSVNGAQRLRQQRPPDLRGSSPSESVSSVRSEFLLAARDLNRRRQPRKFSCRLFSLCYAALHQTREGNRFRECRPPENTFRAPITKAGEQPIPHNLQKHRENLPVAIAKETFRIRWWRRERAPCRTSSSSMALISFSMSTSLPLLVPNSASLPQN